MAGLRSMAAARGGGWAPSGFAALAASGAALAGHGLLWGLAAPLGRLPAIGASMVLLGVSITAWAAWALRRAGTPWQMGATPLVLVEEGPYRWSRHPMYGGLALALAGGVLALGSPTLALAALGLAGALALWHVPAEEAALRRRFGGWYSDYAAAVRRWI